MKDFEVRFSKNEVKNLNRQIENFETITNIFFVVNRCPIITIYFDKEDFLIKKYGKFK